MLFAVLPTGHFMKYWHFLILPHTGHSLLLKNWNIFKKSFFWCHRFFSDVSTKCNFHFSWRYDIFSFRGAGYRYKSCQIMVVPPHLTHVSHIFGADGPCKRKRRSIKMLNFNDTWLWRQCLSAMYAPDIAKSESIVSVQQILEKKYFDISLAFVTNMIVWALFTCSSPALSWKE